MESSTAAWWAPQTDRQSAARASRGDSDAKTAFAAIVAFTLILLISPQNWFPILKPFRIAFLAAGLGVTSLLWERWQHRRPLGFSREVLVCLALVAWAFVTLPLSYWPSGSLQTLTDLYVKAVIVFWLLANVVTTVGRLRLLSMTLMLCTIVLSGTAVKNYITGSFLADDRVSRIVGYEGMLSSNPNDLALMLNLLIPLGVALAMSARNSSIRIFWLGVVAIDVVGVIVTFSRGGFLALATVVAVYFTKLVRRPGTGRRLAFTMLFAAMLSLPLVPATYVDRLSTVTDIHSDPTGSSQSRWRDMVAATHFVMAHPIIGAGIGMDALALNEVRGVWWTQVHNVYLEYAVDLGLPGALLFIVLLGFVWGAATRSVKELVGVAHAQELFVFAEALQVSLMAFIVSSFFHPVAYHFYFYYIAGLALAIRRATADVTPLPA